MYNKKWEQLIDLVINEDNEKASQLFHEIIVETSRHVYEGMMEEDMMDESKEEDLEEAKDDEEDAIEESMDEMMGMEEGMHGQVGDLMDEISAEESGVMEDDVEFDDEAEEAGSDMTHDLEAGHDAMGGDSAEHGHIEGKLETIEDKLDKLMDEFEEIMGKGLDGEEEAGEEDFEMSPDGEEEEEEEEEVTEASDEEDMDESVMENVNLPKVPGVKHGDDGANAKSPTLHEPRVKAEGVKPVKFSGQQETVPTSPKGPSNAYSKGEGKLPGAGNFANTPGKNNFAVKGQSAPKPKHGDDGSNKKSPVATK